MSSNIQQMRSKLGELPHSNTGMVGCQVPQFPGKRTSQTGRVQRLVLVLGAEAALCGVSFLLSVGILKNGLPGQWALQFLLLIALPLRTIFLYLLGPFRSSLRHGSVHELLGITKAITLSTFLMAIFLYRQETGGQSPLALLVMDWGLCQLLLGVLHFGAQIYQAQTAKWRRPLKRIAVVGAGDAGATLVRELTADPNARCRPAAIFDDNP